MRALYTRYYRQNKGFLTADLLSEAPGRRHAGRRHVLSPLQIDGRDSLPYEAVFAKAGIVFHRDVVTSPFVGVSTTPTPSGGMAVQMVSPGSSAETAGVQPGDVVTNIGGISGDLGPGLGRGVSDSLSRQGGAGPDHHGPARGKTLTLNTTVQEHTTSTVTLRRAPSPTAKQAKVWQGLASGL